MRLSQRKITHAYTADKSPVAGIAGCLPHIHLFLSNKDLVFLGCEHAQMNEYTLLQLSVAMGEASGSHRPDLL